MAVASRTPTAGVRLAYRTASGSFFQGLAEDALRSRQLAYWRGKVDLILTSPPFPLNRKKSYGNLQGDAYVAWLAEFAPLLKEFLADRGSVVMELGNAWEPGRPVMSTLSLKALLAFLGRGDLVLCQQFVVNNPARLPSPAQWVNIERIRVKDSYTHVWWMALTDRPDADNRRVLKPYSDSMLDLLQRGRYNSGPRPSDHDIGEKSFLRNNNGAIPSNVLSLANTQANDNYLDYCRTMRLKPHPARMGPGLAEFFIKFLTQPGGIVLDPFAGSNTTGAVAENLGRRWVAVEPQQDYIDASWGRFASRIP